MRWRTVVAGICVGFGALAIAASIASRYVRDNILHTDRFVAIIAPLPQDPRVADALANYTTSQLFDASSAKTTIQDSLPPRLAPLADPLTDALKQKVNQVAKKFVQSDAFQAIWTTSNRVAQSAVLRVANSKQGEGKLAALSSVNFSELLGKVRAGLGNDQAVLTPAQKDQAASIRVELHQSVEQLRSGVAAVRTAAHTLPYVAAGLLLAALAIAINRRRTFMAIGITLGVVAAALLIAIKIISGNVLGDITNSTYRAAADVMYGAFYADLHRRIMLLLGIGIVISGLALLFGPYPWARTLRIKLGARAVKKSAPYALARNVRRATNRFEPWLALVGAVIALIILLAAATLTTSTLVIVLSVLVSYLALIRLIARPATS